MRVEHYLLPSLLAFYAAGAWAQGVAVGGAGASPDASAILDVQSNQKGLLAPRMTAAQRAAIASPATGLLVFQTDGATGFYYNNGTPVSPAWTLLPAATWGLSGNAGTNPAANFLGTVDANAFAFRTNNTERMQIRMNGTVMINGTVAKSSQDALEVFGAGVTGATNSTFGFPINGYSTGGFAGIYGENNSIGQGVLGINSSTGAGVFGHNTSTGIGVYGNSNSTGIGVHGHSATGIGVEGQTNSNNNPAIRGFNQNANGIGVVGLGGGISVFHNVFEGTGVLGQGEAFGVAAIASSDGAVNTTGKWAGYFDYRPGSNSYAYIGGRSGSTDYAILSTGVKSTMVKDDQNRNRVMFCPEAPEVLFQDVGAGQLVNGRAHITIDPLLSRNIYVSESKPLKVFIQPEGECKGVYVTNKSAAGFDVIELQGGISNTPFTYQLIANRADNTDAAGRVTSRYAETRFPIGPERVKGKAVAVDAIQNQAPITKSATEK